MHNTDLLVKLLAEAKLIARQYYYLTGKPLGITGKWLNMKQLGSWALIWLLQGKADMMQQKSSKGKPNVPDQGTAHPKR
ncbi:MAG: hypothetical protein ABI167_06970 [Nitrosospira sp.]